MASLDAAILDQATGNAGDADKSWLNEVYSMKNSLVTTGYKSMVLVGLPMSSHQEGTSIREALVSYVSNFLWLCD